MAFNTRRLRGQHAPLFKRQRDRVRFPAFLSLRANGMVTLSMSDESTDGFTEDVAKGITIRFPVSPYIRGDALADFIDGPGASMLQAIHEGHRIKWNGYSRSGTLTNEARKVAAMLARVISLLPRVPNVEPDEWLNPDDIADDWPESLSLGQAVKRIEREAESYGVILDGDIEGWMAHSALTLFRKTGSVPENYMGAIAPLLEKDQ